MLISTLSDGRYAIVVNTLLAVTIGFYAYSCRIGDNICSPLSGKFTPMCSTISTGGIAIGIGMASGLTWRMFPRAIKTYVSLVAISPTGFLCYSFVSLIAYAETLKVIWHIRQLTMLPLTIVDCLKRETEHSLQLLKNSSSFEESHVNNVKSSVSDIVSKFNEVNGTQHQFKTAVEIGFNWLESRGLGCQQVLTKPFEVCLNASEMAKRDCRENKGAGPLCDLVGISEGVCKSLIILSKTSCQDLGSEKIFEILRGFRSSLGKLFNGAIRMRVGILFEIHTTSQVESELKLAWDNILTSLNSGSFFGALYGFAIDYFFYYIGIALVFLGPVLYLFQYVWGSNDFDNNYISRSVYDECVSCHEIFGLPLPPCEVQVVRVGIPTLKEVTGILRSSIFSLDQWIIALILIIDYYYTNWVNDLHNRWMTLFSNYESNLFSVVQHSNRTGVGWIGELISQQLDKVQDAIGLCRLQACARPAPNTDYSYSIFFLALSQRLLYFFVLTKYRFINSFICARFYRRRHYNRMRYLRSKILLSSIKM